MKPRRFRFGQGSNKFVTKYFVLSFLLLVYLLYNCFIPRSVSRKTNKLGEVTCDRFDDIRVDDGSEYHVLDDSGDYITVDFDIEDSPFETTRADMMLPIINDGTKTSDLSGRSVNSKFSLGSSLALSNKDYSSQFSKKSQIGQFKSPEQQWKSRVTITSSGRLGNNICQYAHLYLIGLQNDHVEVSHV